MTIHLPKWALAIGAAILILAAGLLIGLAVADSEGDAVTPADDVGGVSTSETTSTTSAEESVEEASAEEETSTAPDETSSEPTSCGELLLEGSKGICQGEKGMFELVYLDDTLQLDTLDARVEGIATKPYVGARFIREEASGIFLVISLAVTNTTDRPEEFSPFQTQTVLEASDGKLYNEDFGAENTSDPNSFLSQAEEIGPGITLTGNVIFDVPPEIADEILSPKTDASINIMEFSKPGQKPTGAIVLRDP